MKPRTPPFNTGKVLIGSRYEPDRSWHPSRDAYDLQSALLSGPVVRVPWHVRLYRAFVDLLVGRPV